MSKQRRRLDIVVIGGSNAGLMVGILLKRRGHNIRVLEQAASNERQGLAAGIGLYPYLQGCIKMVDQLSHEPMGILHEELRIVDTQMNVVSASSLNQLMTTWDKMYYRLRANFDHFKSAHCPDPPPVDPQANDGNAVFLPGSHVSHIESDKGSNRMVVYTSGSETSSAERYECDIVIAADGANSRTRRQLNPHLQREEPGYLIWRGTTAASEVQPETLDKIEGHAIKFIGEYFYCIVYTIPGDNGTLSPSGRHINFVAYFWPFTSIDDIMTDVDGHRHRSTVPKGKLRPEIWATQVEAFRRLLPAALIDIVEHIREPFVSVIASIGSPRAAYFDNRLFVIGDALTQSQPNIAMGSSLAAMGAMSLAHAIDSCAETFIAANDGDDNADGREHFPTRAVAAAAAAETLRAWNDGMVSYSDVIRTRSAAFAAWHLCSWPRIALAYARSYAVACRHRWWYARSARLSGVPVM